MHHTHHHEPPNSPLTSRIVSAAEELLSTYYLCGSQRDALRSFERKHGAFTDAERERVYDQVDEWIRQDQIAAGVVAPMSATEREQVERDLDSEDTAESRPRFEGWGDSNRWGDD